ncbi:MAG: AsmA family protein [Rhodospirillales bacterium]
MRKKTIWKLAGLAVALVLAIGLILPFIDAPRFRSRVRAGLEEALGRRVEVGEVHLDLFNGPGFSAENVVIHEDPRVSLEPFAYVESVEARVNFISLWAGRLEFSKLRLVNPRVNLTRPAAGGWNFGKLLPGSTEAGPAKEIRLPEFQVRGGRINFKSGNTKSIFYIIEASMDAVPPASPGGEWRLRFEGQPARTDRRALGFGVFTARGHWRPDPATGGTVDLALNLERSSLAELVRLIHGHDVGVHGQVASTARMVGPVSDVRITGRMQVSDIHRWDQLPPYSAGWAFDYAGRLDLVSQTLDLQTVQPAGEAPAPVSARLRAAGYLDRPVWAVLVSMHGLPLAPFPEIAFHMGQPLPPGLVLEGDLRGVVGYSPDKGIQGTLVSRRAEIKTPNSPVIRLENAELRFDGAQVLVSSTALRLPADGSPEDQASFKASYTWSDQALNAVISTRSMSIPEPGTSWARLLGAVPLVQHLREGKWWGQLTYRQQGGLSGEWSGTVQVEGTRIPLPGFGAPLEVDRARIVVKDGEASLERFSGRLGTSEIAGTYRYRPKAAHPHQFTVKADELDAADLERLLMPALRRDESFLTRALRLGRTRVPEWLAGLRAEGVLEAGRLTVARRHFPKFHARIRWEGTTVQIPEISARWSGGVVTGRLTANLRRAVPAYRLEARFRSVEWMGGDWDGRGVLQTSGTGAELLENLRAEGTFQARSVSLDPDTKFKSLSGACSLATAGGLPRIRLTDLEAITAGDAFKGRGGTGEDGRIHVELTDGHKQMRLAAAAPFQRGAELAH